MLSDGRRGGWPSRASTGLHRSWRRRPPRRELTEAYSAARGPKCRKSTQMQRSVSTSFSYVRLATLAAGLLLVGVALFQTGLALGVPWGSAAYGGGGAGTDGVLPTGLRISSAVAAAGLL